MEKIKADIVQPSYNHNIVMQDRKKLSISGVSKIESFDEEEFVLETSMGVVIIKGHGLEISKLDTNIGDVNLRGEIGEILYLESDYKGKKGEGMFSRLFR